MRRARAQLDRLTPKQAHDEHRGGALLVDIRQESLRRNHFQIPDSLVLERNVLEWRLDPTSPYRIPEATDHDIRVIVICPHGYASSLAAVMLHAVGLHRATDVIGGFQGWVAAGLPVVEGFTPAGSFVSANGLSLSIDYTRHEVVINGRRIALSRLETLVLGELLQASGRLVTRDELRELVGDWEGSRSRSVDSIIFRIRRKLGSDCDLVSTERAQGYRLHMGDRRCTAWR